MQKYEVNTIYLYFISLFIFLEYILEKHKKCGFGLRIVSIFNNCLKQIQFETENRPIFRLINLRVIVVNQCSCRGKNKVFFATSCKNRVEDISPRR